jgi:hypothetical protein
MDTIAIIPNEDQLKIQLSVPDLEHSPLLKLLWPPEGFGKIDTWPIRSSRILEDPSICAMVIKYAEGERFDDLPPNTIAKLEEWLID